MKTHPQYERTLVIIKPDGIQRSLIGESVKRYEQIGLKLVGIKMLIPTAEMVEKHYTLDPEWRVKTGEKTLKAYEARGVKHPISDDPTVITGVILKTLVNYLTSGPVVAMVWEGAHAVEIIRKLTGGPEPRTSYVGTIRGDYVIDSYAVSDADKRSVRNLVHASGSVKEANDEIPHWFKENELFEYNLLVEKILYGSNLDGILN